MGMDLYEFIDIAPIQDIIEGCFVRVEYICFHAKARSRISAFPKNSKPEFPVENGYARSAPINPA